MSNATDQSTFGAPSGHSSSVSIRADAASRPPVPAPKFDGEVPTSAPFSLILACQVVGLSNLLGLLASRVDWLGGNRVIDIVVRHTALFRSASVASLGPADGGGLWLAEIAALLAVVALGVVAVGWVGRWRTVAVAATGAWWMGTALAAAGVLRLANESLRADPVWIGRVVWLITVVLSFVGGLRVLTTAARDRSRRWDVAIVLGVAAAAVAVPVMQSLGRWGQEPTYPLLRAMSVDDATLDRARPWLYASGVAPLALVGGLLLLRPPRRRWFVLALGVVLVGGSSVYLGRVERDRMADTLPVTVVVTPSAARSCTVLPFGGDREAFVVSGDACTEITVVQAGTPVATGALDHPLEDLGSIADPILGTSSSVPVVQVYDGVVVLVERDDAGTIHVVGRSLQTLQPAWSVGCPAEAAAPGVHLSGGLAVSDAAANRTEAELFGLRDYVAIACGGETIPYDPRTGAPL